MAKFTELFVARSDGQSSYIGTNGRVVPNEPPRKDTRPQADGSVDYYLRVENDDPTSQDWRRKLGGLLAKALGAQGTHARTRISTLHGYFYTI